MEDYNQQNHLNIPTEVKTQFEKNDTRFRQILEQFTPISLEEMDEVKLMNRVDTKFVIHIDELPAFLDKAKESYRALTIEDEQLFPYTSIYFDTDDSRMYIDHHNGKRSRFKVRTRTYIKTMDSFLEIKEKNNKNRTSKRRVKIPLEQFMDMSLTQKNARFIDKNSPYKRDAIDPVLQNYFQRITLVDNGKTERITIDLGVYFQDIKKNTLEMEKDLVVVELKQDRANRQSHFRRFLYEARVQPIGMSKYCYGMILLNPDIKKNRFKEKIRTINKLTTNNYVTN